MYIIIVLIFISLTIAIGFLMAFFWAVKEGQFEDGYTPSVRILIEDSAEDGEQQEMVMSNKIE